MYGDTSISDFRGGGNAPPPVEQGTMRGKGAGIGPHNFIQPRALKTLIRYCSRLCDPAILSVSTTKTRNDCRVQPVGGVADKRKVQSRSEDCQNGWRWALITPGGGGGGGSARDPAAMPTGRTALPAAGLPAPVGDVRRRSTQFDRVGWWYGTRSLVRKGTTGNGRRDGSTRLSADPVINKPNRARHFAHSSGCARNSAQQKWLILN